MTKIVLLVSDLRQSRRFYQALGFRVLQRDDDAVTVAFGEDVVELRSDARAAAGPHYFTPEIGRFPRGTGVELAFDAPDIEALYALARSLDVDLVDTLDPGAGDGDAARTGRAFRMSDPDGYLLRFTESAGAPKRRVRPSAVPA